MLGGVSSFSLSLHVNAQCGCTIVLFVSASVLNAPGSPTLNKKRGKARGRKTICVMRQCYSFFFFSFFPLMYIAYVNTEPYPSHSLSFFFSASLLATEKREEIYIYTQNASLPVACADAHHCHAWQQCNDDEPCHAHF